MSIWKYAEGDDFNDQYSITCKFCRAAMQNVHLPDYWSKEDDFYFELHNRYIMEGFLEIHDLSDQAEKYLACTDGPCEHHLNVSACPACGWWSIHKQVYLESIALPWNLRFRSEGVLRTLDLDDIETPIREVRAFIRANYEARFAVHPRKFEELVASIFEDFGYQVAVTTYTSDGGIDVVLNGKNSETIGVQVKRYREKIKVEQIRSFIGALVLNGYTKGYFVTTSSYQAGVTNAIQKAAAIRIAVDTFDYVSLFEALEIAQVSHAELISEVEAILKSPDRPLIHFVDEYHLGSL